MAEASCTSLRRTAMSIASSPNSGGPGPTESVTPDTAPIGAPPILVPGFLFTEAPLSGMRWGRLQADVNVSLRRGAWYRITRISGLEATIDVNRQAQVVPSYLIQVVSTPPRSWTVVPRPRGAPR